ncbi:class I SAM-dependent methyltransferase [Roseospira goensis]|uniref:Ubiquinone/menaquinone biosynthesis C-methyltransferase UbiE n=1 Tax=Roseospira goensis TaxID=391922 RepID=A0A7W6WM82_9PROT|nr:demethylmenaquinone methyltransferase/2-methoxy-6-polyprenyl-1,4-benzoquinol methylase [Roseospira goensis]
MAPAAEEHPQDPRRIRAMFDAVAPRYDLMNDIMSFGIHRRWKRRLRRMAGKPFGRGLALDLAGGTGDIADELSDGGWAVVVCDASEGMMATGRDRNAGPRVRWVGGDAERLPFPDGTFDLVTLGFGLRNFRDRDAALAEIVRVLAPEGRFLCLEFSTPARPIRGLYRSYSRRMIPRLGAAVAGKPEAYRYLIDSIADFPDQRTLVGWFQQAGLTDVRYRNLMFGIAAIHGGRRPAAHP